MNSTPLLQRELPIRFIKVLDLGFIGACDFIIGYSLALIIDNSFGKFDKKAEAAKSTVRVVFEVIGLLWMTAITIYVTKNFFEMVPSPLDGIWGFEHKLVKELKLAPLLSFAILYYQSYLQEKLKALYNRFAANPK